MAAVTLLGSQTFNTTNGSKTVTATPAAGDLIILLVAHTGNTATTAPTDDNPDGRGTYTLVNTSVKASSADTMKMWVRNALIGSASSTVFTTAPGTTSGGGLAAIKVTGMSRYGGAAIRQSAVENNLAAATPAPVFGVAALTANPVIGAVFNATTTAATMTPRSSPAYTELFDVGYSTPTTGLEVMSIDSGETGTTITWGSASSSAFGSIVAELDTSAAVQAAQTMGAQHVTRTLRTLDFGYATPNLLLTTLVVATLGGVCRGPSLVDQVKKRAAVTTDAPNLLLSSFAPVAQTAAPFVVNDSGGGGPRARVTFPDNGPPNILLLSQKPAQQSNEPTAKAGVVAAANAPNLLTGTLAPVVAGDPPFVAGSSEFQPRAKAVESQSAPIPLLLMPAAPVTVPIFGSAAEYQPRPRVVEPQTPPNALLSTLKLAADMAAAPVLRGASTVAPRAAPIGGKFDAPNLLLQFGTPVIPDPLPIGLLNQYDYRPVAGVVSTGSTHGEPLTLGIPPAPVQAAPFVSPPFEATRPKRAVEPQNQGSRFGLDGVLGWAPIIQEVTDSGRGQRARLLDQPPNLLLYTLAVPAQAQPIGSQWSQVRPIATPVPADNQPANVLLLTPAIAGSSNETPHVLRVASIGSADSVSLALGLPFVPDPLPIGRGLFEYRPIARPIPAEIPPNLVAGVFDAGAPVPVIPTPPDEVQSSGGWAFHVAYEQEQRRRREESRRRKRLEEEREEIEDETAREIAELISRQEAEDEKRRDLERLAAIAKANADLEAARAFSERVAVAYQRALDKGTFSALEALDRELKRAAEEEEFMQMALALLLGQQ